jgi:hypothetical protein
MTQMNGNDMDTAQSPSYETPTFDPRSAFAWTLRSGEIALRERRQGQSRLPHRDELASTDPGATRQVNGAARNSSAARRYETPTFNPRSAFARTLRSGEIARLERLQPLPNPNQLDVLLGASRKTLSRRQPR